MEIMPRSCRESRTGRRHDRGGRDLEQRVGVGVHLQPRLDQLVTLGLDAQRLVVRQEVHEHLGVLLQGVPLRGSLEADHRGVSAESPRPETQHRPPARQVVEHHEAVGDPQRVVIGQREHSRPELDAPRQVGDVRDEQHGITDRLHSA
jgi:hypothetical protein